MASAQANLSVLREMVNSKYDVNLSDYDGRNALHLAAENGHLEVVKYYARLFFSGEVLN